MARISVIVFTDTARTELAERPAQLEALRTGGAELILVGPGAASTPGADRIITHSGSAAKLLNSAAAAARGDVLVFVHAGTCLPPDMPALISHALAPGNRVWGRFDLRYSGNAPALRLVEGLSNLWSRYMDTGSLRHGIFVTRLAYEQAGRFPDIPLFSDIAFCRALRQLTRPACVRTPAITSSTHMEAQGIWKSVLLSAWLRLSYSLGVEPGLLHALARRYRILDAAAPTE